MKISQIDNLLERRARFTPLIPNIRATTAHYIRKISGCPIRLSASYVSKNIGTINMRIFIILSFLSIVTLSIASCSTLPSTFSTETIMKVHQGMSSDEILELFGKPKNISASVCGRSPNQWTCTTWEYGEFPYDRASFTFSGEHDSLILNNFKVDRD